MIDNRVMKMSFGLILAASGAATAGTVYPDAPVVSTTTSVTEQVVVTTPSVVTIHDLRPIELPDTVGGVHGAYLRSRFRPSARNAAVITTPSEYVRGTVIDLLDADPEAATAVVCGPPAQARRTGGQGDRAVHGRTRTGRSGQVRQAGPVHRRGRARRGRGPGPGRRGRRHHACRQAELDRGRVHLPAGGRRR